MEKQFTIPDGVDISIDGKKVTVKGTKGTLERAFKYFHDIKIEKKGNAVVIISKSEERKTKAMVGTIRSHIKNMADGVTEGFTTKMKIIYSHFPMSVKVEGDKVMVTNFIGEKTPRVARIIGKVKVEVNGQDIMVTGLDKEDVGQTSGNIEQICRISKFDRRVFQDGIYQVKN